jgi:hypothetical protein
MSPLARRPRLLPPAEAKNVRAIAPWFSTVVLLLAARGAEAAPATSLAGTWKAEPMTVRWVIGSWGEACGPRPSGGGDAGGDVTIEERGGELVIQAPGGAFSSTQCWQMHPGLEPTTHSAKPGVWKTTCRTGGSDARQEILQTTLSLSGDVLSLQESGQYQFVVQGQTCAASSGRWRSYRRGAPAAPPPVEAPVPVQAPPVAKAPSAPSPCATPGAPARLEVRPSRKLMRAGETFHFRSSVFDAQGCSLGTPVTWTVSSEDGTASIDAGRLTLAAGVPDGELRVTASVADQSVRVSVEVVSDDRYAALLASGEFNADGASSEAASATITSGSLGARAGAASTGPSSERKWTFVGVVSAIALLFAVLGAWLLRRAQRSARRPAALGRTLPDTGTAVFPGGAELGEAPRRLDRTRLEPVAPPPAAKPATVCPLCGTMYDTRGIRVCPKDGAQLLPINA